MRRLFRRILLLLGFMLLVCAFAGCGGGGGGGGGTTVTPSSPVYQVVSSTGSFVIAVNDTVTFSVQEVKSGVTRTLTSPEIEGILWTVGSNDTGILTVTSANLTTDTLAVRGAKGGTANVSVRFRFMGKTEVNVTNSQNVTVNDPNAGLTGAITFYLPANLAPREGAAPVRLVDSSNKNDYLLDGQTPSEIGANFVRWSGIVKGKHIISRVTRVNNAIDKVVYAVEADNDLLSGRAVPLSVTLKEYSVIDGLVHAKAGIQVLENTADFKDKVFETTTKVNADGLLQELKKSTFVVVNVIKVHVFLFERNSNGTVTSRDNLIDFLAKNTVSVPVRIGMLPPTANVKESSEVDLAAELTDSNGNFVDTSEITWSISAGSELASFKNGLATGQRVTVVAGQGVSGTAKVTARYNANQSIFGISTINIAQDLDSVKLTTARINRIVITPQTSRVALNNSILLNVMGFTDVDGAAISLNEIIRRNDLRFKVIPPAGATETDAYVNYNGIFTGLRTGTFEVTVNTEEVPLRFPNDANLKNLFARTYVDTSKIFVYGEKNDSTPINLIKIFPEQATIFKGQNFQFKSLGFDAAGAALPVNATWTAEVVLANGSTREIGLNEGAISSTGWFIMFNNSLDPVTVNIKAYVPGLPQVAVSATVVTPPYLYKVKSVSMTLDNNKTMMLNDDANGITARAAIVFEGVAPDSYKPDWFAIPDGIISFNPVQGDTLAVAIKPVAGKYGKVAVYSRFGKLADSKEIEVRAKIVTIALTPDVFTTNLNDNNLKIATFRAIGRDAYGNNIPSVNFKWSVGATGHTGFASAGGGTVENVVSTNGNAAFTGTSPGTCEVQASFINADNSTVTSNKITAVIIGKPANVTIAPAEEPQYMLLGTTRNFGFKAYDVNGTLIPAYTIAPSKIVWSETDPLNLITVSTTGVVTANNSLTGDCAVAVNVDGNVVSRNIRIVDTLTGIVLRPSSLEIEFSKSLQMKVFAIFGSNESEITDTQNIAWAIVSGGSYGTLSNSGLFNSGTDTGAVLIRATYTFNPPGGLPAVVKTSDSTIRVSGPVNKITGFVRDAISNAGVSGAYVLLTDANTNAKVDDTVSGVNGEYSFYGIPTGSYIITVYRDDYLIDSRLVNHVQ